MDAQVAKAGPTEDVPTLSVAASLEPEEVLRRLGSGPQGLTNEEVRRRLASTGHNVLRARRARPWRILGRQLKSPILLLLFITAGVSVFLGEAANAAIIGVILAASVGLGFFNEFRAEQAADALHDQIRHEVTVMRDGKPVSVDVTELAAGDVVQLGVGSVVPAEPARPSGCPRRRSRRASQLANVYVSFRIIWAAPTLWRNWAVTPPPIVRPVAVQRIGPAEVRVTRWAGRPPALPGLLLRRIPSVH